MKKLILPLLALLLLSACQNTPQKNAVNTLTTIGMTANDSYEAYLGQVLSGSIPTNDVPKVTAVYREFQASFGAAAAASHFATNTTFATPELAGFLTKLQVAIDTARKGGK